MSIIYKNTEITDINYKGVNLDKVIFNGTTVYEKIYEVYIDADLSYTSGTGYTYQFITVQNVRLNRPFKSDITIYQEERRGGDTLNICSISQGETQSYPDRIRQHISYATPENIAASYPYIIVKYTDSTGQERTAKVQVENNGTKKYSTTIKVKVEY